MRRRSLFIAAAIVHLLLIIGAGSADLLAALAKGDTFFPNSASGFFAKAESLVRPALGQSNRHRRFWSESMALYLNSTGCEAGYNFFAPHVPGSRRLVFELRYIDGRIEYEFPYGDAIGSKVRLACLLDLIGHIKSETVRQQLIRIVAEDSCRGHKDVAVVRAIFGIVNSPAVNQYENGTTASYQVLYTYDYTPQFVSPVRFAHD